MTNENSFWRVCEALDCMLRLELLGYLMAVETTEFPCVNELAERFGVSAAAMSVHLKKLSTAGLVASKRADRRVYYRAFATSEEGERVNEALHRLFAAKPDAMRLERLRSYAHALSHARRAQIVRCLQQNPGLPLPQLVERVDMPPQTADRLWGELNKARIVDLNGIVVAPPEVPERVLLELTVL